MNVTHFYNIRDVDVIYIIHNPLSITLSLCLLKRTSSSLDIGAAKDKNCNQEFGPTMKYCDLDVDEFKRTLNSCFRIVFLIGEYILS